MGRVGGRREGGIDANGRWLQLISSCRLQTFFNLLLKPNDDPAELFLDDVNGAINYLKLLHTGGDQTAT